MPPSSRKPAAKKPDDEAFVEAFAEPEEAETGRGDICAQCWPRGWPSEDSRNASCVHGVWKR